MGVVLGSTPATSALGTIVAAQSTYKVVGFVHMCGHCMQQDVSVNRTEPSTQWFHPLDAMFPDDTTRGWACVVCGHSKTESTGIKHHGMGSTGIVYRKTSCGCYM